MAEMSDKKLKRTLIEEFLPTVPGLVENLQRGGAQALGLWFWSLSEVNGQGIP